MLTHRFDEALVYAAALHRTQLRKQTRIPYVSHLLIVAGTVLEHGADEDEAIAALLHDAAEDQGGQPTLDEIRTRFGERVAEIVAGCTDAWEEPKPAWRPRKEAYFEHLRGAPESVLLVSIADKLHNARAILQDHRRVGDEVFERFTGGLEGTLWYFRTLVDRYRERDVARVSSLVDELDRVVGELERRVSGG